MTPLKEVKEHVRSLLPQEGAFAVLDFDNTYILGDTGESVMTKLCNIRGNQEVANLCWDLVKKGEYRESCLVCAGVLEGVDLSEIDQLVSVVIKEFGLRVNPTARELVEVLKERGIAIWIVSASSQVLVESVAKQLGIEGKVIGLQNKVVGTRLQKEFDEPYSIEEGKVECIKAFIHPTQRPVFAFGDTVHDIPMLRYATKAAVIAGSHELEKEAKENNWFIL